jgi:uncharacterized protein YutD
MTSLPTIHLNGTSREMLLEGYDAAYRKLLKFRRAFQEIEFNARDYYVVEPEAWSDARQEREKMLNKISELTDYLEEHLVHLAE